MRKREYGDHIQDILGSTVRAGVKPLPDLFRFYEEGGTKAAPSLLRSRFFLHGMNFNLECTPPMAGCEVDFKL